MEIYLQGKRVSFSPKQSIGKGGEADVYDLDGSRALKLFKPPDHPDYAGNPLEQQAAQERIRQHQQKLRLFPHNLPPRVVSPQELATDKAGQAILGFTMRLLKGAHPLLYFADRQFQQSVGADSIPLIFGDLHTTVNALHKLGIIIGDFNNLNVLVQSTQAFLIDADSFQFGNFPCTVYTQRYLDPLLYPAHPSGVFSIGKYNIQSDWYAFAVMLMECLLFTGPYGGVYLPKDPSRKIPQELRPLQRITIFHSEVRYPKPAIPIHYLPDDLLHQFQGIFDKDLRVEFPLPLLDQIRWTRCSVCGTQHARACCPVCFGAAPSSRPQQITVRGKVTSTRIFHTSGWLLNAAFHGGKLHWLYHQDGAYRRENGEVVLQAPLGNPGRFRICKGATLMAREGHFLTLETGKPPVSIAADHFGNQPVFDANERFRYWLQSGHLFRDGPLGPIQIADVLEGQTWFWVGSSFGFGYYRAANLQVSFLFDADGHGINDRVGSFLKGRLIDSACVFSEDQCWFMAATQSGGKVIHQCWVIRSCGSLMAYGEAEPGDGSWLSTLEGKVAVGNFLLVPTDEGIVRVEVCQGQILKTRDFPDTEPFVDCHSRLIPGEKELYVVSEREIRALALQGNPNGSKS